MKCSEIKVGYAGQRYEVRASWNGKDFVVGWTNEAEGGKLAAAANKVPYFGNIRVVDLWRADPPQEQKNVD